MEERIYQRYFEIDRHHFWRHGKRRLTIRWMRRYLPRRTGTPRLLDIGSGPTLYPKKLQQLGDLTVIEPHEETALFLTEKMKVRTVAGELPGNLPVEGPFDGISMLDVLEHVEDEQQALQSVHRLLADDGVLLLTVPAYQWMWSPHDDLSHHYRRYTATRLRRALQKSGFRVERITYYTSLLFPIAVAQRTAAKLMQRSGLREYEPKVPHPAINQAFGLAMRLEFELLKNADLPFGLCLLCAARKRGGRACH